MYQITKMTQLPEECLFFGYGSLMVAKAINGRGMSYLYKDTDLFTAFAKGLKRGMSAEWVVNPRKTYTFYGMHEDKDSEVFGVLFKIHSKMDLIALLEDEYASPVIQRDPMYRLFDISDRFEDVDTGTTIKLALLCKARKNRPNTYAPNYVEYVYNNMPDRYREKFIQTGGLKA